jgi:hypothetical protein
VCQDSSGKYYSLCKYVVLDEYVMWNLKINPRDRKTRLNHIYASLRSNWSAYTENPKETIKYNSKTGSPDIFVKEFTDFIDYFNTGKYIDVSLTNRNIYVVKSIPKSEKKYLVCNEYEESKKCYTVYLGDNIHPNVGSMVHLCVTNKKNNEDFLSSFS